MYMSNMYLYYGECPIKNTTIGYRKLFYTHTNDRGAVWNALKVCKWSYSSVSYFLHC